MELAINSKRFCIRIIHWTHPGGAFLFQNFIKFTMWYGKVDSSMPNFTSMVQHVIPVRQKPPKLTSE